MKGIVIREIRADEFHFLENALYEAIYQPENEKPFPREIIEMKQGKNLLLLSLFDKRYLEYSNDRTKVK